MTSSLGFIGKFRSMFTRGSDETEYDRGRERMRRIVLTTVASFFSRLGSAGVLLLTVPMALSHLGPERFGVWMVISSLAAVFAFADLGIGNGMITAIALASGRDDKEQIKTVVSTGFFLLAAIGFFLAVLAMALNPLVDWANFFQLNSPIARQEAGPAVLTFILCFAAGLPAGVASKVQLALQRGYEANFWQGLGGILSLVAVTGAIHLNVSLPIMIVALFGSQQIALLVNHVVFLYFQCPHLAPTWKLARGQTAIPLLKTGMAFFLLQLVVVVSFRIDSILVIRFFGPEVAGAYSIVDRMFSVMSMLLILALSPLWPAYGEAISRGDVNWMKRTLTLSLALSIGVSIVAGAVLVAGGNFVIHHWIGPHILIPLSLLIGFAFWKALEVSGTALSMLLNGAGIIRLQTVLAIVMAIVSLSIKLLIVPTLGPISVIWITALVYLCCSFVPLIFMLPKIVRDLGHQNNDT